MPTYDHTVSASDIIRDALLNVGALDADESADGAATSDALRALNNLLKSWQGRYHLWTREEAIVPVVKNGNEYSLGSASTDAEWCLESDFITTLLNGAHASGSTLTVDSTTGMATGDRIGIELTAGTRQWTTIKSIASSTSLTLSTALTGAASDNGTVFTYTSRPQRPIRVIHARRGPYSGTQTQMNIEPLEEYFDQPDKTSTGTPIFLSYKPALTSGVMYVWPAGNSVTNAIRLTVEYPIADLDTVSDNADFPVEWNLAITLNLSVLLDRQYRQLDTARRRELAAHAVAELERIERQDSDIGSVYFQPSRRR